MTHLHRVNVTLRSYKLPCTPPTLSATFKNSKQSHTQQSKNPNS